MAVSFFSEGVKTPKIAKRKTTAWIKAVAEKYGFKVGNITFVFCSDEYILQMNRDFLKHDYYTDIITFDYTEDNYISGDIFISIDTVLSNSQKFDSGYDNELNRVIIHGILHLCGITDKTPDERKVMERCENEALMDF